MGTPEPSASPNARLLVGTVPHGADERVRFGNSIMGSAFTHIGGFVLALFVIDTLQVTPRSTPPVDDTPSNILWLNASGPGRRGGDGGDGSPLSPREARRPRRDTIAPPAATPPQLAQDPLTDLPRPDTEVNVEAIKALAGLVELPGALTGLPAVSSAGSDAGGGAGTGTGTRGSGLEPGTTVESGTAHSVPATASPCQPY